MTRITEAGITVDACHECPYQDELYGSELRRNGTIVPGSSMCAHASVAPRMLLRPWLIPYFCPLDTVEHVEREAISKTQD